MYFKLDKSLCLKVLLELVMQLQKYIWILQVGEQMKCMSNLADKFETGIIHYLSKLSCWEEVQISWFDWQLKLVLEVWKG